MPSTWNKEEEMQQQQQEQQEQQPAILIDIPTTFVPDLPPKPLLQQKVLVKNEPLPPIPPPLPPRPPKNTNNNSKKTRETSIRPSSFDVFQSPRSSFQSLLPERKPSNKTPIFKSIKDLATKALQKSPCELRDAAKHQFLMNTNQDKLFQGVDGDIERATLAFKHKPSFCRSVTISIKGEQSQYFRSQENTLFYKYERPMREKPTADGIVFVGIDLRTGERVAFKKLNPWFSLQDANKESYIHQMMGTSRGPLITDGIHGGEKYYIVMKFIEGKTLEAEVLDPKSTLDGYQLYLKAKHRLRRLHRTGYYHGDSNSGNFIVETKSRKVLCVDYTNSGLIRNIDDEIRDFVKLAHNTRDECRLRPRNEKEKILEEIELDLVNPERNCVRVLGKIK